ncbi:hypothetical protein CLAIMM_00434 [Cladophialophora immunda]|nr:hypothetical protein CLAIMM_00434 [Cladophialophora immunda]
MLQFSGGDTAGTFSLSTSLLPIHPPRHVQSDNALWSTYTPFANGVEDQGQDLDRLDRPAERVCDISGAYHTTKVREGAPVPH